MSSILRRIAELETEGTSCAVVTVVRVSGSTPRSAGAKMIVFKDGAIEGTIGGGKIEHRIISAAKETIETTRTNYLEFSLTNELGMCCGGKMAVFIEPMQVAPKLVIFGAGHVSAALSRMATHAGFIVHIADERTEWLTPERFPEARQLHDENDAIDIPSGDDCYIMITTHDHALDQALLEKRLRQPFRWIGVIGSQRKASMTYQRLRNKGFEERLVESVRIPVGLAISAETPEEIAVSILGELIAVRRQTNVEKIHEKKDGKTSAI